MGQPRSTLVNKGKVALGVAVWIMVFVLGFALAVAVEVGAVGLLFLGYR